MLATIGYERSELDDFVSTLLEGKIEVLVDVRDRAQSRRPGFSKTALAEAVGEVGIAYVHFPALGDPKPGREAARAGDFDRFREIFAEVLRTEGAQIALREIEVMAISKRICLMCFERDQHTCHRKIISDQLERTLNYKTSHLGVRKGAGRRAA